eukprot:scaffold169003_cov20-Tisochrysis_lutea.AAC.1
MSASKLAILEQALHSLLSSHLPLWHCFALPFHETNTSMHFYWTVSRFVTTLLDWDELQKQQTWQPLPFLPHAPAATFSTFRLGLYLLPTPAKYNHHTTHFKISPLLWPVHTALSKLALPLVLRSCACRSITPGCTHLAVSHQQTNMLRVSVQLSARERLMMHAPRICLQTYIDTAFNKIDTDGDGYISLEELMDLIPAQPR